MKDLLQLCRAFGPVVIDTREVETGAIFFAVGRKDENGVHRGAAFAEQALAAGAKLVVHNQPAYQEREGFYYVEDAEQALWDLARLWRQALGDFPILAIAGSNGKTTTRQLCAAALRAGGLRVFETPRNWNNQLGLPLSLLRIRSELYDLAILEIGANHLGETEALTRLAAPQFGLLTNCGKDHLGEYGSWENVVQGNAELYKVLAENPESRVFVHAGDALLMDLSRELQAQSLYYGSGSELQAQVLSAAPLDLRLQIQREGSLQHYRLGLALFGGFWREAVLAALRVALHFGLKPEQALEGLAAFRPQSLRSEFRRWQGQDLLLDCYNANPSSMEALIHTGLAIKDKAKVLVLGEMLELGVYSEAEHRAIFELTQQGDWEAVFFFGAAWQAALPAHTPLFAEHQALRQALETLPPQERLILVKGSRGNRLEQIFT